MADTSSSRAGLAQRSKRGARWAEGTASMKSPYLALAARPGVLAAQLVL
ncbi:MAG: hypothetical protein U0Z44_19820 [Kouleothrix sp.]